MYFKDLVYELDNAKTENELMDVMYQIGRSFENDEITYEDHEVLNSIICKLKTFSK